MTHFEEKGVELQQSAASVRMAERRMAYSCELCSGRGLKLSCDSCAIWSQHQLMLGVLEDLKAARQERAEQEFKRQMAAYRASVTRPFIVVRV